MCIRDSAITDGVVLLPSALGITTGSFPSITETHEFVVPKSIPIILLIILILLINDNLYANLNYVTLCHITNNFIYTIFAKN